MKKYQYLLYPSVCLLLFIIWTTLVKVVDQHYIDGVGFLGFYQLNTNIKNYSLTLNNDTFSLITSILLILSFLTVIPFVAMGIVQLVVRKSFKKVDPVLYALLGVYIAIAILYFVFELVKINFSPLSTSENLKASYPSTHVFVFVTLSWVSFIAALTYLKPNNIVKICGLILLSILAAIMSVFRLFSLNHYFSDIVGSLLLSLTLVISFYFLIKFIQNNKEENAD